MKTNHDTLEYGIKEILQYEFKIELRIITTKFDTIRHKLTKYNLRNISLNFVNWHLEWDQEILKTDIVIIPYINDVLRLVKSPNRITDSLDLGKFVIMSKADQFNEFKNYCYFGNIGKGLEWLKNNEKLAIKMISNGQKYVQKKYSIKDISEICEKLINKTMI